MKLELNDDLSVENAKKSLKEINRLWSNSVRESQRKFLRKRAREYIARLYDNPSTHPKRLA